MSRSILFDESLPFPLREQFQKALNPTPTITFVQEKDWTSFENGDLLQQAQQEFNLFITADTNIQNHTDLSRYNIGLIVLQGLSNRLEDLTPLIPQALLAIENISLDECIKISYKDQ